jgi:LPS-assembly protein
LPALHQNHPSRALGHLPRALHILAGNSQRMTAAEAKPPPPGAAKEWSRECAPLPVGLWATALLCLMLILPTDCTWAVSFEWGEALSVEADRFHFDHERQLFVAEGNVRMASGLMDVTCDSVEYSELTGDFVAEGNVVLTNEEGTVVCERVEGNVRTLSGTFFRAAMDNYKGYTLTGEKVDRVGDESYRVEQGTISECGKERPLWELRGRTMNVREGEYVTARGVTLRLGGVPILYSPYFAYPIKTARQSGFLPPLFGEGGRNGASIRLDYFQALSVSRDATMTYEYLEDNGNLFALEYRYAISRAIGGVLFGRYIHDRNADRNGSRLDMNKDRWEMGATHYHNLGDRLYGGLFMDVFSDGLYLNDFSRASEARVQNNGQSDLTLVKRWAGGNLGLDVRYYQELGLRSSTTTLQSLPEIRMDLPPARLGMSNWFYSLKSSILNFHRREDFASTFSADISSDPMRLSPTTPEQVARTQRLVDAGLDEEIALRHQGIDGQRLDLFPGLSLPLDLTSFLVFTPSVGYRGTLYSRGALQDDSVERGVLHAGFDLASRMHRDFRIGEGRGLRHIVEPRLSYAYRPRQGQADIPIYDEIDRMDRVDAVHLKLINRLVLTGRPERDSGPETTPAMQRREVLTVKLDALYDRLRAAQRLRRLSGEMDLSLRDGLYLEANANYDFETDRFQSLNVDFTYRWQDILSVQLGRRFTRTIPVDPNRPTGTGTARVIGALSTVNALDNDGISFWTTSLNWQPTEKISAGFSGYFNANEDMGDDLSFHVSYETRCWGIALSGQRFDDTVLNDRTGKLEIDRVNEVHLYFTIKSFRLKLLKGMSGI